MSNPIALRRKCVPFPDNKNFTEDHKLSIKDLKDTFDIVQGYGLALPQIGISKRAVVVSFPALGLNPELGNVVMINPEIETSGDTSRFEESCFSVPHISANVSRYTTATVRYTSESGELCALPLEGFPAVCLQHEIDHLDGLTFLNRVGNVWRSMLMKKINKIEKRHKAEEKLAKDSFEQEHKEIMGVSAKKKVTGHSKKRKPKPRKKRLSKSKKRS